MRRRDGSGTRPPGAEGASVDMALLAVAILGICMTGPIIAASDVPALALAAWRCAVGAAVIGLATVALRSQRRNWRRLNRQDVIGIALSGVFLAAHFGTWVPSIRMTTVASSTALVATQPVWAALLARWHGQRISRGMWLGITVALAGAVLLAGTDFAVASGRALLGDALALLGALLAAAYVTAGERVRARVSTSVYSVGVYTVAAAALAAACMLIGDAIWGFDSGGWGSILALTVFGQLMGHTLINRVVPRLSATVTSTAILFEMPGSTLVAAVWLGQRPPPALWPSLGLVLLGLAIVLRHHARPSAAASD